MVAYNTINVKSNKGFKMKFDFNDPSIMASHFMLQNIDVAKAISETPEWKDGMNVDAKLTINGVEVPFDIVEEYYQQVYDRVVKDAQFRFVDLEKAAHQMAETILEEQAKSVRDKLWDLGQQLDDIGSILTPWYEKKSNV